MDKLNVHNLFKNSSLYFLADTQKLGQSIETFAPVLEDSLVVVYDLEENISLSETKKKGVDAILNRLKIDPEKVAFCDFNQAGFSWRKLADMGCKKALVFGKNPFGKIPIKTNQIVHIFEIDLLYCPSINELSNGTAPEKAALWAAMQKLILS